MAMIWDCFERMKFACPVVWRQGDWPYSDPDSKETMKGGGHDCFGSDS
jgi:hypothetical protein